jgi:predicted transposase/invertase (TIGR01784 family)
MVPGIDPKVDYAFKRLFGSEANQPLLIHLLNAVLQLPPEQRVAALEILNPFNDKEALDDKLSVVDIKARDQRGRQFNIEMQLLAYTGFSQRVLYYWARLHQQQLHESEDYEQLQPTISICFVNRVLFPGVPAYHLSFRLWEAVHQVAFTDDLAIHMLELPKFTRSADELKNELDDWLYFLRYAEELDTQALPPALRIPEIQQAMEVLTMLTQSDLERERYEARLKLERDRISFEKRMQRLATEGREQGRAEGREEGRAEGREEGRAKGREEGRAEGREEGREEGRAIGEVIGRIHVYQELLGQPLTPMAELLSRPLEELTHQAEDLKQQLNR